MKRETLVSFGEYEINGDIDEVIKKFQKIRNVWKKAGYVDIKIEIDDEWGYYDEHNIIVKVTGVKEIKNGRDLFK